MTRAICVFIGFCLVLAACTQRMVCPAYQSAFIHDKDELRKKFSYFLDDSTPKVLTASKNKYLVAEAVPYQRKLRTMKTVAMKPVPVHVPDSLTNADSVITADLDRAARSVIDSTMIVDVPKDSVAQKAEDSVYVITKDKELRLLKYNMPDSLFYDPVSKKYVAQKPKYYVEQVRFNLEQDSYMWYLRDVLVLPDVRIAKLQQSGGGEKGGSGQKSAKKKQGLKGFFKNLFKKKPKAEIDSTTVEPPKEEFDYVDPDTLAQKEAVPVQQQIQPKEKKGLFGPKKVSAKTSKKKNKKQQKADVKVEDKKKPEDDGF